MENNLENQKSERGEVWSSSVIAVFSILFSPLVGAVLAAINYKRTGNFKKGIYLVAGTVVGIFAIDLLAYLFAPQHLDVIAFAADVIFIIWVLYDQKVFYENYEKAHPDTKPRGWPSALLVLVETAAALLVFVILVSIILSVFNVGAGQ